MPALEYGGNVVVLAMVAADEVTGAVGAGSVDAGVLVAPSRHPMAIVTINKASTTRAFMQR
jgi:hypothetical protein